MRILAAILLSLLMLPAFAWDSSLRDSFMNKVSMRFTAEQYVATKTALVTIAINAGVNDTGLEKIQDNILKNLNKLIAGDWHITSFNRSQDQSGLEKVMITAQARLAAADITNLRQRAKSISKPGETYSVENVEFTPSEDELRAANIILRSNIYQQAKEEVDRLNKMYPDQKFYIHNIDFLGMITPMPMAVGAQYMQANAMRVADHGEAAASSDNNLSVGNKVTLSAIVVLAAMPDHGLIKNIT